MGMLREYQPTLSDIEYDTEPRYALDVMGKTIGILVRVVWLALCFTALAYAHRGYQGTSDWKMEEGLAFDMIILSFPCSFLIPLALSLIGAILGFLGLALPESSRLEMTTTWFAFVMAGYAQWFILLPRLLRLRKRTVEHPGKTGHQL